MQYPLAHVFLILDAGHPPVYRKYRSIDEGRFLGRQKYYRRVQLSLLSAPVHR